MQVEKKSQSELYFHSLHFVGFLPCLETYHSLLPGINFQQCKKEGIKGGKDVGVGSMNKAAAFKSSQVCHKLEGSNDLLNKNGEMRKEAFRCRGS